MADPRDYRSPPRHAMPAPVVAIAGWAVPGLGYALIGQRARAWFSGTAIVLIFVAGLLIAGVRCVDVPGYDAQGNLRTVGRLGRGQSMLRAAPIPAILDKPWYIPQVLAGPIALGASVWSIKVSDDVPKSTGRLWDIGTLYTAVAGMLNLLTILDAAHRAARIRDLGVANHPGPM